MAYEDVNIPGQVESMPPEHDQTTPARKTSENGTAPLLSAMQHVTIPTGGDRSTTPDSHGSLPTVRHVIEDSRETTRLRRRKLTAYERFSYDLNNDERCIRDITLGKRIGFYRFRGDLGHGNFSQVKVAMHLLTKEKVAVKILDKTKLDLKTQRLLSREISNIEKLHHPNVIRLYEVVETLTKLYMVMEYAPGGELFTKIQKEGKLPEHTAAQLYAQIIAAVRHIHTHNIVHRDVKAENVFFANDQTVKLGDLGFSTTCVAGQLLSTFCGSPPYAAPELFRDESYVGHYVDVWAMGVLLYFMVVGTMPFRADTVGRLKLFILEGTYVVPSFVSDGCQFLIRNVLRSAPSDRFTLQQMSESGWLSGHVFPEAHSPVHVMPAPSVADVTNGKTEHLEVREALKELGITDTHIKESRAKSSRSSITGTYRIMLHKIQKRNSSDNLTLATADANSNNAKNNPTAADVQVRVHNAVNATATGGKAARHSRFCVVL